MINYIVTIYYLDSQVWFQFITYYLHWVFYRFLIPVVLCVCVTEVQQPTNFHKTTLPRTTKIGPKIALSLSCLKGAPEKHWNHHALNQTQGESALFTEENALVQKYFLTRWSSLTFSTNASNTTKLPYIQYKHSSYQYQHNHYTIYNLPKTADNQW